MVASTMGLSGCSTLRNLGDFLSEADAANAIKEALIIGSNFGSNSLGQQGSFGRDILLNAVLPQEATRIINALDRLGLAPELNRFTSTLDIAATDAVKRSAPIFVNSIRRMSIMDAIGIVKNGGTSATDYLRRSIGDTLRGAVRPVMRNALNEYNIENAWDKLIGPAKVLLGSRAGMALNLDNVLTVLLTNEMFKRIEQQEIAIRTDSRARTTNTLQRVFGRDWSQVR